VGQDTASRFLRSVPDIAFQSDGTVNVDTGMQTGATGIFAGGDMVPSERTVTAAVGHGKKAARHIDAWLRNTRYIPAPKHDLVGYEKLHIWYLTDADQKKQDHVPAEQRNENFSEIVAGLNKADATFEAQRCFSCGNCFECDGCYAACPENAVIKLEPGNRYRYDYDLCTGCAVCFEQCPCHAIEMVAEMENKQ
jgi:Pyruvate/2-oxoacid:ferredoxin oxidoreductase delta subunit